MSICKACGGSGRTQMVTLVKGVDFPCIECNGSGEVEMTNEEWIRSATTEELVGAIYEWHSLGYTRHRIGRKLDDATIVLEWLKEKRDADK